MIPGVFAAGAVRSNGPSSWVEFTEEGKSPDADPQGKVLWGGGTSGLHANARVDAVVTGKRYFSTEIEFSGVGSTLGVGFIDSSTSIASVDYWVGDVGSAGAWGPYDYIYENGTDISPISMHYQIEWAVDAANRAVWLRNSGDSWIGGGDPEAGTLPTFVIPGSGGIYFCASIYSGSLSRYVEIQSDPASVTGAAPAGFSVGYPR